MYALNTTSNTAVAETMAIVTFSMAGIFALACNDQLRSVFSQETLESQRLIRMIGWSLLLLFVVVYMAFCTACWDGGSELTLWHWVVAIALGSAVLWHAGDIRASSTPAPLAPRRLPRRPPRRPPRMLSRRRQAPCNASGKNIHEGP